MTPTERAQVLMIKGAVSELPKEEQGKIVDCCAKLSQTVAEYGDSGKLALVLTAFKITEEME